MLSAALQFNNHPEFDDMAGPFTASALFHIVLLVIIILGLPVFKQELPPLETHIAVEILPVDEDSFTKEEAKRRADVDKPFPKPPEQEVKPMPKRPVPAAPKMTAEAPPRPKPPSAPDISDEVALPRAENKPKPAEKPKTPPKPADKPKPRSKPMLVPSAQQEEQDKQQEDFNALLRNLDDTPAQQQQQADAQPVANKPSFPVPLADRMTMSEMDLLKQQLAQCWNVVAGARYAENIIVKLNLTVAPNGVVKTARVTNPLRYQTDSFYAAAADSALRAVRDPYCTPLKLPVDKYDQWKDITVTFDPREML